jgi:hypothetical protein
MVAMQNIFLVAQSLSQGCVKLIELPSTTSLT